MYDSSFPHIYVYILQGQERQKLCFGYLAEAEFPTPPWGGIGMPTRGAAPNLSLLPLPCPSDYVITLYGLNFGDDPASTFVMFFGGDGPARAIPIR
jgi:hypothetical protein